MIHQVNKEVGVFQEHGYLMKINPKHIRRTKGPSGFKLQKLIATTNDTENSIIYENLN